MPTPQPGDRIRLVATLDGPDPIPPGTTGTVAAGRQKRTWAQLDVEWDNGRTVPPDRFEPMHGEVRNTPQTSFGSNVGCTKQKKED